MMSIFKNKSLLLQISADIFQSSFFSYLFIILIENYKKGIVSDYINLNLLLIIIILSGVIMIVLSSEERKLLEEKNYHKITRQQFLFIIFLGLLSGLLIYIQIQALNWIAYIISFLSGVIIFIVSYLLLNEE